MNKGFFYKIILIFILLIPSSLVEADDQGLLSATERSFNNKKLNKANTLILQRKPDEAISVLKKYQQETTADFDSKILLAEAYLEKCNQMEETMNASGKEYKDVITIPFKMGKSIMVEYKNYNDKYAYGSYLCAKSYHLNERPERAKKYSDYAIEMSLTPDVNFFILKADVLAKEYCKFINIGRAMNNPSSFKKGVDVNPSQYQDVIQAYDKVIRFTKNNLIRSQVNYKIGFFEFSISEIRNKDSDSQHIKKAEEHFKIALKSADHRTRSMSYFYLGIIQNKKGNSEMAKKSFSSALNLAEDDNLKKMIQENMN